jgi:alpha-beta hydrolase superfamily lysophospholipase
MSAAPAAVHAAEGEFRTDDGVRLACRAWLPARPQARVIIVHGLGEHSGRYAAFAAVLAGAGLAAHAFDLRGHGRSPGPRGHALLERMVDDVEQFRLHVQREARTAPAAVVGQSMGGLIALRYLQRFPGTMRAAVAASPWLATALPVPAWKLALAALLSRIGPALPLASGLDPDGLSRDAAAVAAYRADPLVHTRISPRLFSSAAAAMRAVERDADRIGAPLLLLAGGADPIVDTRATRALAGRIDPTRVELHIEEHARHELLHELDRDRTAAQVRDWLVAHL